MRCMNTMTICWITMIRPAQAAMRPTVLATPSNARTQPQRNPVCQMPTTVITRKAVNITKKNSDDPP
jgi:hypothetical protein